MKYIYGTKVIEDMEVFEIHMQYICNTKRVRDMGTELLEINIKLHENFTIFHMQRGTFRISKRICRVQIEHII